MRVRNTSSNCTASFCILAATPSASAVAMFTTGQLGGLPARMGHSGSFTR